MAGQPAVGSMERANRPCWTQDARPRERRWPLPARAASGPTPGIAAAPPTTAGQKVTTEPCVVRLAPP
eukprot:scaffold52186_cov29-Tisochrysis_lutea.AAC.16